MNKAAIVIGVNRTGNLPVLRAGVSGAKQFATWLTGEGFDVRFFGDDQNPVTAAAITQEITALVDQGTLEQLVVYFSGHGFLHNYSEFWMLSGAPRNANEAISVRENIELARECGIPSVAMISDACRSTPQSLLAERVRGSLIFPNEPVSHNVRPEIDRYFATLPGDPALEMVVDESVKQHEGVFTYCFLQAYRQPDAEMIRQVVSDGQVLRVVPNRSLKEYLRREVPVLMRNKNLQVGQLPDAIVESGDSVYIGRTVSTAGITVTIRDIVDVRDVARVALSRAIGSPVDVPKSVEDMIDGAAVQSDFDVSVGLVSTAQGRGTEHFETRTGFKVFGAHVSEALGLNMQAELLDGGVSTEPAYVRLHPGRMSSGGAGDVSSVVLRFADGSGTVLAGIENYIGTVVVDNGRVVDVSYVPSDNSYRWHEYAGERARLEKLRAIVATAARFGVFRVDRENASEIADQIRYLKSIDPTLGLYAAYAYAEVGLRDQVQSVMDYMKGDLSAMLFDVAMLAGTLAGPQAGSPYPVVPFCPMLSQGWTLLRVKRAKVPPAAEEASNHLLPALWTTFDPTGINLILRAIHERRIS
ncbi:MAG: caspase family protein [Deltaproteobacteria bacterium]|nr:caspase family protein [Deltaproteobacteria bacterium]